MNVLINGEPWEIEHDVMVGHTCCDCGLRHEMWVTIKRKKAILRFYRDNYATKEIREKEGIIVYRKKAKKRKQPSVEGKINGGQE